MLPKQKTHETESRGVTPTALQSDPAFKKLAEKAKALTADNFLSAAKLKITERQRNALIKTLMLMKSKAINEKKFINGKRFGMNVWIDDKAKDKFDHPCGTVCCIGGTASLLDDGPTTGPVNEPKTIFHGPRGGFNGPPALGRLFYEWGSWYDHPTVERSAAQLRHFLKTGTCPSDWSGTKVP